MLGSFRTVPECASERSEPQYPGRLDCATLVTNCCNKTELLGFVCSTENAENFCHIADMKMLKFHGNWHGNVVPTMWTVKKCPSNGVMKSTGLLVITGCRKSLLRECVLTPFYLSSPKLSGRFKNKIKAFDSPS